tara:strand:+ start:316 stop:540 length:225 start_codon:yes stop_codon:yes gene_type:complete
MLIVEAEAEVAQAKPGRRVVVLSRLAEAEAEAVACQGITLKRWVALAEQAVSTPLVVGAPRERLMEAQVVGVLL